MYGFLRPPSSLSQPERTTYKKYMCTLCDSLHDNHGIRGRLFVNYDAASLALLVGSLDTALDAALSEPPRHLCLRLIKHQESPATLRFISEFSVMVAYLKLADRAAEKKSRRIGFGWLERQSDLAGAYLSRYGLGKPAFERMLAEQHRVESEQGDMEALSAPTAEIVSRLLCVSCELTGKAHRADDFRRLGLEVGRLIYVLDGLIDYQKDLRSGAFNCIYSCYGRRDISLKQVSEEVYRFVDDTRNAISRILGRLGLAGNVALFEKILFQDITAKEGRSLFKPSYYRLSGEVAYGILAGVLLVETSGDGGPSYPSLGSALAGCCLLAGCGGWAYETCTGKKV